MSAFRAWLQKWFGIPLEKISPYRRRATMSSESNPEKKESFRVLRVQPTPNPDAFQFVMNSPLIASGTKTFDSADEAISDPFAEALFQIFGVENVFLQENYVTVTKSSTTGWHTIFETISKAIENHLTFYEISESAEDEDKKGGSILDDFKKEDFEKCSDAKKALVIDAFLDKAIRPALANDGGGLDVLGIEGNTVKIHYQGACGSCPSSTSGTLQYIENFLKDAIHPSLIVRAS